MQIYPVEELAWAIAREREQYARQTRPHTEESRPPVEPLPSRLAAVLFHLALRLGASVGKVMASALIVGTGRKSSRV